MICFFQQAFPRLFSLLLLLFPEYLNTRKRFCFFTIDIRFYFHILDHVMILDKLMNLFYRRKVDISL